MTDVLGLFIHSAFFLYSLSNNVFSQSSKCPSGNLLWIVFFPSYFAYSFSRSNLFCAFFCFSLLIISLQKLTDITWCHADVMSSMRQIQS